MTPLEKIIDHHKYLPQYLRYRADVIDGNTEFGAHQQLKIFKKHGILFLRDATMPRSYDMFRMVYYGTK